MFWATRSLSPAGSKKEFETYPLFVLSKIPTVSLNGCLWIIFEIWGHSSTELTSSRMWVLLCLKNIHPKKMTSSKRGCDHGVLLGCPGKQWSTDGISGVFSKQGVSWYIFPLLHLEMCKLDNMQRCARMAEREKDWWKLCFNYSRRKAAPFGPLQLRKKCKLHKFQLQFTFLLEEEEIIKIVLTFLSFRSERLAFSQNYLIFSDLLQPLTTLDRLMMIKIKLMPHFYYVRLIKPTLIITWLIQQTKKNNHQVSKKWNVLQAHYIYTFANLARAAEAQQRWLIQLKSYYYLLKSRF